MPWPPPSIRNARPADALKIADLELSLVGGSASRGQGPWGQGPCGQPSLLVRLAIDSGAEGWGEARCPWRPDEIADRRRWLLPALAGRSVCEIEELLTLDALQAGFLRSAVEMACWDALARDCGLPLAELWGGAYRQRAPVAGRLPGGSLDDDAAAAEEWCEQGIRALVLPVKGDADARRDEWMERLAGRVSLRLDLGPGVGESQAERMCARWEGLGLSACTDPLAGESFERSGRLRERTSLRLALARSIHSPRDVMRLIRAQAADLVVIDLEQVGGLTAARKCAAVAEAADLPALLRVPSACGLAAAAALHLACATPWFGGPIELSVPDAQRPPLVEPSPLADGLRTLPAGPGLGIEVDRARWEVGQG